MPCPCGLPAELDACCGRFLSGAEFPSTAEELMRSRYTAYTQDQIDYIVTTHDPDSQDDVDRDAAEAWAKQAEWLGLEIRDTVAGTSSDDTGEVEFVARYKLQGGELSHHERAGFRKQSEGHWCYVDGEMIKAKPVVRETPKVGRNEPCPCDSGKKFKKCCGR